MLHLPLVQDDILMRERVSLILTELRPPSRLLRPSPPLYSLPFIKGSRSFLLPFILTLSRFKKLPFQHNKTSSKPSSTSSATAGSCHVLRSIYISFVILSPAFWPVSVCDSLVLVLSIYFTMRILSSMWVLGMYVRMYGVSWEMWPLSAGWSTR